MGLLIMMGIFTFGVVIGVPVAFALGIGAVSAFYFEGLPLIIAFQRIISGINVFSLLAIPFFIFAGEKDVFVHVTALEAAGLETLDEGQKVTFETSEENGKVSAVDLKLEG